MFWSFLTALTFICLHAIQGEKISINPAAYQPFLKAIKHANEDIANGKVVNGSIRHLTENEVFSSGCTPSEGMFLPGHDHLGYGFNFIKDKSTFDTEPEIILEDTWTTTKGASIMYNGVCYHLPDAFVSDNGALGYQNNFEISSSFEAKGSTSSYEFQRDEATSRSSEASLEVSGYGASVEAAFSLSETNKNQLKVNNQESMDSSQAKMKVLLYGLKVMNAYPSKKCILEWRNLYENLGKYAEFYKYYENIGTHYFQSARVGGELSMSFSIKKSMKLTASSSSKDRALCVSAKASATYFGVTGSASAKHCSNSFVGEQSKNQFTDYTSDSRIHCKGGNTCPVAGMTDSNQANEARKAWQESVVKNPRPLYGTKIWIFELMDRVIRYSKDDKRYQEILERFGNSKNMEENITKMRKLKKTFKDYLINHYVGKDFYCSKVNPRDIYCARKNAVQFIQQRSNLMLSPLEWPSWFMYARDSDEGWFRGWSGNPGPQGHFIIEPIPGRPEAFFLRVAKWPEWYMYMEDTKEAYVRLNKGDPGTSGHWIFTPNSQEYGTFLISPAKWRDWYIFMNSKDEGWIQGWKGDPGKQGHWVIKDASSALLTSVKYPSIFAYTQNNKDGWAVGSQTFPGDQGKFYFIPVKGYSDRVYITTSKWPRYFLYMQDTAEARVGLYKGVPPSKGQWIIRFSKKNPGSFVIYSARWKDWFMIMHKNQMITGANGVPGDEASWTMSWI